MSLPRFSIIVSTDSAGGISRSGDIPWVDIDDGKFFKDLTITSPAGKRNAVIMGRKTYETIPEEARPLANRVNIVISKTWVQEEHLDIKIAETLVDALACVPPSVNTVFVCGGAITYKDAMNTLYLCDKIYLTKFRMDYHCDEMFPALDFERTETAKTSSWTRYIYNINVDHAETKYLSLLKELKSGDHTMTPRGSALAAFTRSLSYDLRNDRLPILTTRRLSWSLYPPIVDKIIKIFRLDEVDMKDVKIHIAQPNAERPITDDNDPGLDIENVRVQLLLSPNNILSARVDLPHVELFDELPDHIVVWSVILRLLAAVTGVDAGFLHIQMGQVFILNKNSEHVTILLRRTPRPMPVLQINNQTQLTTLKGRNVDEKWFKLVGYTSWTHV